ncbi:hypothetical protein BUALT_Bualt14G0080300 [Buddleja alternifolia]|uniref:F-box domain-containing protein n=1 Tax=Buddleja alternifolia TaxID=168488 RepID=A0AAV6WH62_9LAMI|nr:hypothetical protein BUALT_Bualt14G0080300 [Buddleja alternifolia]
MEEGKTVESMADEIQLPEVTIQHIQSFLDRKQAARSSVLSKSWHSAWSTRPILDFDERDFQIEKVFAEFVNRTMQRYHELKLKIEDFRLRIKVIDSTFLANKFIKRAMQLRVNDFCLEIIGGCRWYHLPVQVFEAKSLINLSVTGCTIDQQFDGNMICSNIESLSLCKVFVRDDTIRDIMLRFPLLKNLYLYECMGLLKVNLSKLLNLKKFSVITGDCRKSLSIEFEARTIGPFICNRVNVPEYGKLSCLILEQVKIDEFFFHDLLLKFPCLEDLSVHHCDGYNNLEISSGSLRYISLMHRFQLKKAKFEVPSICKFKFSAFNIPSLSFMTPSREFESYISLRFTCWSLGVRDCWFLALKKFLTELSSSRISLKIMIISERVNPCLGDNRGFPIPVVENLIVNVFLSSWLNADVLEGVFRSCRPKFVTVYDDDDILKRKLLGHEFITRHDNEHLRIRKLLCKLLVQQASQDWSYSAREFSYMNDLEEVNVESFEETLKKWRPLPWQALLDFSKIQENKEQLRFRLRWRAHTRVTMV